MEFTFRTDKGSALTFEELDDNWRLSQEYKDEAGQSAGIAVSAKDTAVSAKNAAQSSASNAATSESNAAASENTASTAAANALTSETNAATSETNAGVAATTATDKAAEAVVSAGAAADSEDAAAQSAADADLRVGELDYAIDSLQTAKNQVRYGDGPYPVLDMNFIGAGMIDPRANFSRATPTWDWDEQGNFRKYEIDEPVFAYDPVTGEAKGLQVYPARTNLFADSVNMGIDSAFQSGSFQVEQVGGRGIFSSGVKLIKPTESNSRFYANRANLGLVTGDIVTVSAFVYTDGSEPIVTNNPGGDVRIYVGPTLLTLGKEFWGGGIWRIYGTGTFADSAIGLLKATTDSDKDVLAFGLQIEAGTTPTPYIPTEGSQVTVAATNLQIDGDLFEEIYNPKAGTMLFDVGENYFMVSGSVGPYLNLGLLGENQSSVTGSLGTTGAALILRDENGTATPPSLPIPKRLDQAPQLGNPYKLGISYTHSQQSIADFGEVATSSRDASGFLENSASRIFVSPLTNGYVKAIKYYNRALTETQLEEITSNE